MIQILLLAASVSALAILINKKAEDILPSYLMAAILGIYGMAILKISLKTASYAVMGLMAAVILVLAVFILAGRITRDDLKSGVSGNIVTFPMIACIAVCVIFALCMTDHRVVHWDDLSYWGIYAKNLFAIDRLPLGVENCTISYKDYNPIMQIMEYFFMLGAKSFDESALFMVNICFMYVLMLPFLKSAAACFERAKTEGSRRYYAGMAAGIVAYVIFPHIFTNQFYYKLGVDYLMSLLFGYGIYLAARKDGEAIFDGIRLVIVLSFLADIKTTGAVLSLFVALFYGVYRFGPSFKKGIVGFVFRTAGMAIFPLGVYFSWKLWGRRTGNHGYLSDKVEDNVRTLAHIFPEYTKDTIINYIKHVFTYPLTRERIGITAAAIIAVCVIVYYLRRYSDKITVADRRLHIIMMIGLVIFCMAHLYMYLFVFDDWEAAGLLEFDRYISQYLAGVFFYYMCNLWGDGDDFAKAFSKKHEKKMVNPGVVILAVMLALLPYRAMWHNLIPANYRVDYEMGYREALDCAYAEWEASPLKEADFPHDEDHRLMVMGDAWSDEFQFFTMAMVPQPVTVVENIPALAGLNMDGFALDLINMNGVDYVYVMEGAVQSYGDGDFAGDSSHITVDGNSMEGGHLYEVVREGDEIMLQEYIRGY